MNATHSSAATCDEPHVSIVARLEANWRLHGPKIGESLLRLIACQESGADVNLSGIDRDLIVYAMARAFAQPQTAAMKDAVIEAAGGLVEEIVSSGTHTRWKRLANAISDLNTSPLTRPKGESA